MFENSSVQSCLRRSRVLQAGCTPSEGAGLCCPVQGPKKFSGCKGIGCALASKRVQEHKGEHVVNGSYLVFDTLRTSTGRIRAFLGKPRSSNWYLSLDRSKTAWIKLLQSTSSSTPLQE